MPQEDNLDIELTVWDNLIIYGRYFGLPRSVIAERAAELLEFVQLTDRGQRPGRPAVGRHEAPAHDRPGAINEPELMLLDEPTTGLDPQARHLLWERLYQLKREGVTLVLTTHYMDEAEQLCDRLVIMDEGRIVDEGSPRQLIAGTRHRARWSSCASPDERGPRRGARRRSSARRAHRGAGRPDPALHRRRRRPRRPRSPHDGVRTDRVLVRRSSLEDVFLILTGRTLDE